MVEDAYHTAYTFCDSLILLDRYFLTIPILEKLQSLNSNGSVRMEIINKTQKSIVAFEKPVPINLGGDATKKWASFHLKELFLSHKEKFHDTEIELYGKKESIRYLCTDLLWQNLNYI